MNKLFLLASVLLIFATSCNKDAELIDDSGSNNGLPFQKIDSLKLKTSTVLHKTHVLDLQKQLFIQSLALLKMLFH